jgi:hypothetical protein
LAPTGRGIEEYFKQALNENRQVGAQGLLKQYPPGGSVKAGVACLAALPTSVKNLVPEPYSLIDSGTVEELYSQCMDKSDNFFDLQKFDRLVEQEVAKIEGKGKRPNETFQEDHNALESIPQDQGRQIILGDHYWSVLSLTSHDMEHPFEPPLPPSNGFTPLRPSSRIRVSRIISMDCPRPRPGWNDTGFEPTGFSENIKGQFHKQWFSKHNIEVDHLDFGTLFDDQGKSRRLSDISYKIAFSGTKREQQEPQNKTPFSVLKTPPMKNLYSSPVDHKNNGVGQKQKQHLFVDNNNNNNNNQVVKKNNGVSQKKQEPLSVDNDRVVRLSLDGETPILILNQLSDIGIVGKYELSEARAEHDSLDGLFPDLYVNDEISLHVKKGLYPMEDMSVSCRRKEDETKKETIQYLASLVLDTIVVEATNQTSTHWYDMSFNELKDILLKQSYKPTFVTVSDRLKQTALSVLQQLCDTGFITKFHFDEAEEVSARETEERQTTALAVYPRSEEDELVIGDPLFFHYERKQYESKKSVKQYLASMALKELIQPIDDRQWYDMTLVEIKANFCCYSNSDDKKNQQKSSP